MVQVVSSLIAEAKVEMMKSRSSFEIISELMLTSRLEIKSRMKTITVGVIDEDRMAEAHQNLSDPFFALSLGQRVVLGSEPEAWRWDHFASLVGLL